MCSAAARSGAMAPRREARSPSETTSAATTACISRATAPKSGSRPLPWAMRRGKQAVGHQLFPARPRRKQGRVIIRRRRRSGDGGQGRQQRKGRQQRRQSRRRGGHVSGREAISKARPCSRPSSWITKPSCSCTKLASDGTNLVGFASSTAALAYDYQAPLRFFPKRSPSPNRPGRLAPMLSRRPTPRSAKSLAGSAVRLIGAYAEAFALTDGRTPASGARRRSAWVHFGDPLPPVTTAWRMVKRRCTIAAWRS